MLALRLLTQVVDRVPRHDHVRYERHAIGITITYVMKQIPHVGGATVLVAYGGSSLHECVIGECAQESNRVEQV